MTLALVSTLAVFVKQFLQIVDAKALFPVSARTRIVTAKESTMTIMNGSKALLVLALIAMGGVDASRKSSRRLAAKPAPVAAPVKPPTPPPPPPYVSCIMAAAPCLFVA